MEEGRFQVAVGAIIEKQDGEILLIHRSEDQVAGGIWEFPIGRLKQFEPFEAGLKREIAEETGLANVEVVMPLNTFTFMRGGKTAEHEVKGIVFWCRTAQSEVTLSGEHTDFRWLPLAEVIDFVAHEGIASDLRMFGDMRDRLKSRGA